MQKFVHGGKLVLPLHAQSLPEVKSFAAEIGPLAITVTHHAYQFPQLGWGLSFLDSYSVTGNQKLVQVFFHFLVW